MYGPVQNINKAKKNNKSKCRETPPAKNHQETVSIKVRNVQGEILVTSEEFGVREEFGSTDTDEYQILLYSQWKVPMISDISQWPDAPELCISEWPDASEQSISQWPDASEQSISQWLDASEQSISQWPDASAIEK